MLEGKFPENIIEIRGLSLTYKQMQPGFNRGSTFGLKDN